MSEPIGTLVNVFWVVFDLIVMSILVRAVLYRGYPAGGSGDDPETSNETSTERALRGPEL
jgi:cellulose synthase (UDP-forming)